MEIKIEHVDLVRSPLKADYILTLRGWTVPKMYYLEEMYKNDFVISGDNVCKPIGYNIKVPMEMFYRNDEKEIIDYIFHCLPPELSDGRTEQLIIEKIYEERSNKWKK